MKDSTPYAAGMLEFERGNFAEAMRRFSEAVAAGDRAAEALSKRGVCRVRLGDREGAAQDFVGALARDPRFTAAQVNLGNLALEAGRLDEAQSHYEAALGIDPDYPAAHHNLGVVYRRQRKYAESVRELRLAAKLEARPRKFLKWLGFRRRET